MRARIVPNPLSTVLGTEKGLTRCYHPARGVPSDLTIPPYRAKQTRNQTISMFSDSVPKPSLGYHLTLLCASLLLDGKMVTNQDKSQGRRHLSQHPSDSVDGERNLAPPGCLYGQLESPSGNPKC